MTDTCYDINKLRVRPSDQVSARVTYTSSWQSLGCIIIILITVITSLSFILMTRAPISIALMISRWWLVVSCWAIVLMCWLAATSLLFLGVSIAVVVFWGIATVPRWLAATAAAPSRVAATTTTMTMMSSLRPAATSTTWPPTSVTPWPWTWPRSWMWPAHTTQYSTATIIWTLFHHSGQPTIKYTKNETQIYTREEKLRHNTKVLEIKTSKEIKNT